jgi:hypothetical protein
MELQFVEKFCCFEISILGCIFPRVCPCFEPLLSLIAHCKVNLTSFWKKEVIIGNIETIYFVSPNDRASRYPFL